MFENPNMLGFMIPRKSWDIIVGNKFLYVGIV